MKTPADVTDQVVAALRARHGIDPLASVAMRARFELALSEIPFPGARDDLEAYAATIAARLRVSETRFYRDGEQLEALAREVEGARGRLRVLSAGCSTGEEAYSIAMLLESREPRASYEITAIDVSAERIAVARSGHYPVRRGTLPSPLRRFVAEREAGVSIAPEIAARCRFHVGDLLTTPLFGPFDAVLCRNVLIYLAEPVALQLLMRLSDALASHGALIVARAEVPLARRVPSLSPVDVSGDVTLFRRVPR